MNICYATDDNFCMQTGISMLSLISHAKPASLVFHLLDAGISEGNYQKLVALASAGSATIQRYNILPFLEKIRKTGQKNWGDFPTHATWARLFLPEILSTSVDRVLYLDGDIIANNDFEKFYKSDLGGCITAGAEDCISQQHKLYLGLSPQEIYINAGVLLFDLTAWRAVYTSNWVDSFLSGNTPFPMADQDVVNLLFRGRILAMPLKYNYSVWFRALDIPALRRLLQSPYLCRYTQDEVRNCIKGSVFIHYNTCSLLVRPWYRNATDPAASVWRRWYAASPWGQEPLPDEPPRLSIAEQKDRRLYRQVGKFWFSPLHSAKRFLNSLRHRS